MRKNLLLPVFVVALVATGCMTNNHPGGDRLTGAWRGKVEFSSGAYAGTKDVEFMYAFNPGGTMTESSNYDASPPTAPAYGVWRKTGARQYEAIYVFFLNKAPADFDVITKGAGWAPDGHGVLTEKIVLAADGQTFTSSFKYELFDLQGNPAAGGGEATVKAERIAF